MNTSDIIEGERVPLGTKDRLLRVLIADDHALFRDGLRRLLEDAGLKVIGQAGDGNEAVALTERLEPDLLLLDMSMPKHSGMEALQELSKNKKNGVRVIVLTAAIETSEIVKALQLGACGVVMKAPVTEVLLTAIQTVMAGGCWVGLNRVPDLFQYLKSKTEAAKAEARTKTYGLTHRELEVISGVVAGMSNNEIASYFKIAEDTVKHHLSNIFDKLGVSKRLELALFSVNHSLPLIDIV